MTRILRQRRPTTITSTATTTTTNKMTSNNSSLMLLLLLTVTITTLVQASNPNGLTPFSIRDKTLQSHIQKWKRHPDATAREYGHIKHWDLRNVTSMMNLFSFYEDFNEDISQWNVSGVTDFSGMFWGATSFEQDLSGWDVSNAKTMKSMFWDASSFTGKGLEAWGDKLHNVDDMFNMFKGSAIEADLSGWNVSMVYTMRAMFMDTPHLNQKLCWDIHPDAVTIDMFNNSDSCLDKKCVAPHIAEMAGCLHSDARTTTLWIGVSLAGLMSLVAML